MARPQKTDQQLLVSILERYFAEVVFGDPSGIRFTDLEKYAASQGISAKEYEFIDGTVPVFRFDPQCNGSLIGQKPFRCRDSDNSIGKSDPLPADPSFITVFPGNFSVSGFPFEIILCQRCSGSDPAKYRDHSCKQSLHLISFPFVFFSKLFLF